jgi:hypothetical protein
MHVLHAARRMNAELVPQELTEHLVDQHRFGNIALAGMDLHQEPVAGLTKRRTFNEACARGAGTRKRSTRR